MPRRKHPRRPHTGARGLVGFGAEENQTPVVQVDAMRRIYRSMGTTTGAGVGDDEQPEAEV